MNPILPIQDTYNIRMADFVRVTTPSETFLFATTPTQIIVPEVDANEFNGVSALVQIGDVQRDIKSTANETTATLVGIDSALLGWVLGLQVKGSLIEMWHGFFNENNELITTGGTGGLYKFFTGYINSFSISEQYMQELRSYVGVITVSAASIQIILQNRTAGRFTNDNAWQFFNAGDTSMDRVAAVETIVYFFGKEKDASLYTS
jgi:hypothetical protein